jgi:hypothetical protein
MGDTWRSGAFSGGCRPDSPRACAPDSICIRSISHPRVEFKQIQTSWRADGMASAGDAEQAMLEALTTFRETLAQQRQTAAQERDQEKQRGRDAAGREQRAEEQENRGTVGDAAAASADHEVTEDQMYELYEPSHCRGAMP